MTTAYLNRIATGVPPHEVHTAFVRFARTALEARQRKLFDRMVGKAHIARRYSIIEPSSEPEGPAIDANRLYTRGAFPSTSQRMQLYEEHASTLAERTLAELSLGSDKARITHLVITSCTGMYAPGIDWDLMVRCGLNPSLERTSVGFMGCFAAINGLKLARHVVRSEPKARVLLVNIELCTLHLQDTTDLEQMLSFLIFGDGCAASLVSAEPEGISLDGFRSVVLPQTADLITWKVRDRGFDMFLSGGVPIAIRDGLGAAIPDILEGRPPSEVKHWAVHPGGRSVLDAVEFSLDLSSEALSVSRDVLRSFGNMSSATVMFVLKEILGRARRGERGCALSFGPGLTAETMRFERV